MNHSYTKQEITHAQLQQDSSETKQDDVNSQNIQGTQEVLITLQVPASGLQHVQPQLLADPAFALQGVQLVQQVPGQDAQPVCAFRRTNFLFEPFANKWWWRAVFQLCLKRQGWASSEHQWNSALLRPLYFGPKAMLTQSCSNVKTPLTRSRKLVELFLER